MCTVNHHSHNSVPSYPHPHTPRAWHHHFCTCGMLAPVCSCRRRWYVEEIGSSITNGNVPGLPPVRVRTSCAARPSLRPAQCVLMYMLRELATINVLASAEVNIDPMASRKRPRPEGDGACCVHGAVYVLWALFWFMRHAACRCYEHAPVTFMFCLG